MRLWRRTVACVMFESRLIELTAAGLFGILTRFPLGTLKTLHCSVVECLAMVVLRFSSDQFGCKNTTYFPTRKIYFICSLYSLQIQWYDMRVG